MSSRPGEARPAKGSGSRSRPLQVPNRGASAGVSGLPAAPVALGVPPQEDAKNLGQRGRSYGMKQGLAGGGERLARSPVSSASRERGGRWEPGPRMRRSLPGVRARFPRGQVVVVVVGEACVEESRESAQHRDLPPRDFRNEGARDVRSGGTH